MNWKIYQIKHNNIKESSLDFPPIYNYPPVKRQDSYLWMETNVIHKAIRDGLHKNCDFFGILAPNYKEKIAECQGWGKDLRNKSRAKFSRSNFENFVSRNKDSDIISLTKHPPHSVFSYGDKYHPHISKMAQTICDLIGFEHNVKTIDRNPIYFNYWIATPEICQAFYDEILSRLLAFSSHKELFKNSGYHKPFPENLKEIFDINYWPYHPFIGERMISIFVTKHKLKVSSF